MTWNLWIAPHFSPLMLVFIFKFIHALNPPPLIMNNSSSHHYYHGKLMSWMLNDRVSTNLGNEVKHVCLIINSRWSDLIIFLFLWIRIRIVLNRFIFRELFLIDSALVSNLIESELTNRNTNNYLSPLTRNKSKLFESHRMKLFNL